MENTAVKRKAMAMKSNLIANLRRSKRLKGNLSSVYLPNDIIRIILLMLPAEFLQDIAKLVCKTWANIIRDPDFAHKHLLLRYNEGFGFIYQNFWKAGIVGCVEAKEGKIIVTTGQKNHLPKDRLFACSDGILFSLSNREFYVSNCITKQEMKLPSFNLETCKSSFLFHSSIAYIPRTRVIKVIVPCCDNDGYGHFHIFTVGGADNNQTCSWRKHDFGMKHADFFKLTSHPISINGVIYWAIPYRCDTMLAVDLYDESFHYFKVPSEFFVVDNNSPTMRFGFQKMGNYLSYLVRKKNDTEVNVWILKNMHTSEWVKIQNIECKDGLKLQIWDHYRFVPIAWLGNAEVLMFYDKSTYDLVAYSLSNGFIKVVAKKVSPVYTSVLALTHTISLISW